MKLKKLLIDTMFRCRLTKKELALYCGMAKYQDEKGHICGVYYKDMMEKCEICKQTFHNAKNSLEKKGVISVEKKDGDYDITILNNDFSYPGAYQEGYVKLSRQVFSTKKYKNLKVNEQLLLLHFLTITHENSGTYQIGIENFYDKYMGLLGVTKRVLDGYIHSLKNFFSIYKNDGKCFITYRAKVFNEIQSESEVNQHLGYVVMTGCRRNKVKADLDTAIKDTVQLIKQYRQEARKAGRDIFEILNSCLNECRNNVLNSKYIHKLIRQALIIDYPLAMETQF